MGSKKFVIIIGLIALTILVVIIVTYKGTPEALQVRVTTEKTEYERDEVLRVKIENNSEKNICFSSCYPYYIEKKNGDWKSYNYSACFNDDLIEKCAGPEQTKAFQIDPLGTGIEKGIHRLAIPVCIDCNLQELFKEDSWFYSNEFNIK